jgi:hypothetical protein
MNQPTENRTEVRFVILFHQFPPGHQRDDHWDLMLEEESMLASWSLMEMPEPGKSISAVRLVDHRKAYLDYEGQVSGNRGSVTRVISGEYSWKPGSGQSKAELKFDGNRWDIEFQQSNERWLVIVS